MYSLRNLFSLSSTMDARSDLEVQIDKEMALLKYPDDLMSKQHRRNWRRHQRTRIRKQLIASEKKTDEEKLKEDAKEMMEEAMQCVGMEVASFIFGGWDDPVKSLKFPTKLKHTIPDCILYEPLKRDMHDGILRLIPADSNHPTVPCNHPDIKPFTQEGDVYYVAIRDSSSSAGPSYPRICLNMLDVSIQATMLKKIAGGKAVIVQRLFVDMSSRTFPSIQFRDIITSYEDAQTRNPWGKQKGDEIVYMWNPCDESHSNYIVVTTHFFKACHEMNSKR
jgi:hypothetical protein